MSGQGMLGAPPAWRMDRWKFYHITHSRHSIMNPLPAERLGALLEAACLGRGSRVVDIGCGKAELLIRLAKAYGCRGTGVDRSPFTAADARRRVARERLQPKVVIIEGDGAGHRPGPGGRYDWAACVGASWIFGGYRGTLKGLAALSKPGGLLLVGEPFWRCPPGAAYLRASGEKRSMFLTHAGNARAARVDGLDLVFSVVSTPEDFDLYEGLQWAAADAWLRGHPDDGDAGEVRARVDHFREVYLRWGRDCLGWACYLLRTPEERGARGRKAPGKE